MPDTIKIPGIGPLDKKYAYIGAAGIAGFVGYSYWRNRQAAAAAPDDGVDTSGLDAATSAADDSSYAYDYSAYGSDLGGYAYGGAPIYQSPTGGNYPTPTGGSPTTDAEWNQSAYEALTDRGIESTAASHALSRYQADLCVTNAEADLVRQAISAVGDTPQTHHNIQICPSDPGTPAGTPPAVPANFRVVSTDKLGVTLNWDPVPNAQMYLITIKGGPEKYNHEVTDSAPTYRFGALTKNSTYSFSIRSVVGGVKSASSATVTGKTKAK